jgi:murein DD-endopeptidase MepM/ murein hydrolase activator NlpD
MLNLGRLRNTLSFSIIIPLTIALTGCLNTNNGSNQNLVLKGSVAELKETVMLDPAFIARQKQAERSFFGFSDGHDTHLNDNIVTDDELELDGFEEPGKVSFESKHGNFGGLEIIWPVNGRLSSLFGMRKLGKRTRMHSGIDISASVGTPIRSSYDGQVLFAGKKNGYGNSVILGHDSEHATLYAHMSKIKVRNGQFVRRDQVIGFVGKTGRVTGANLHYETRISGVANNPLFFLPPNNGKKILKGMQTPSLAQQVSYYQNLSKFAYNADRSSIVSK